MVKLSVVAAYVLVMLAIGFWCMRRTKTVSDFFLGGRTLGPWMSAFAYGTSYFSAVLFVGYAGRLGWNFGIHSLWIAAGNVLFGSILAWWIFAGRTRRMTVKLNALTMPEFLAARFDSKFLKISAALIIFIFLVPYTASVYQGLSLLFEANLGYSYEACVAFMAILTGVYLIAGGYKALAVTDFIRGIIELIGVVVMVVFLASLKGGVIAATAKLAAPGNAPLLTAPLPMFSGTIILISLVIVTSFGPWGLPQMVQKFYSIKSEADIKRAMVVASIFSVLISFGAYYTGALTHLFYTKPALATAAGKFPLPKNLDDLMPHFLNYQQPPHGAGLVVPWVSMVILLLVFSASMSSLSSLVLVSSSAIAVDLFAGIKKNASKRAVMTMMRVLCGVFVAISLWIALSKIDYIMNLMVLSWGALAGAFLAPYCYGLFWKRATKAGAIVGMFSGLATMVAVLLIVKQKTGMSVQGNPFVSVAGAIAMIVPVIVVPIVSLLTPPPDKALIEKAFGDAPSEEAPEPEKARV